MISTKRVGGLRFVRIGRFGFSYFWSNRVSAAADKRVRRAKRRALTAPQFAEFELSPLLAADLDTRLLQK